MCAGYGECRGHARRGESSLPFVWARWSVETLSVARYQFSCDRAILAVQYDDSGKPFARACEQSVVWSSPDSGCSSLTRIISNVAVSSDSTGMSRCTSGASDSWLLYTGTTTDNPTVGPGCCTFSLTFLIPSRWLCMMQRYFSSMVLRTWCARSASHNEKNSSASSRSMPLICLIRSSR